MTMNSFSLFTVKTKTFNLTVFVFFLYISEILTDQDIQKNTMIAGGWTSRETNSTEIQGIASRVLQEINSRQSDNEYYLIPISVLNVHSQVVAGINYKLELLVGKSACLKKEKSLEEFEPEKCKEDGEENRKVYTVTVWQQPWKNFEQIEIHGVKNATSSG